MRARPVSRLALVSERVKVICMDQDEQARRERRLQLAKQAFKDFSLQCFWSCREDLEITEDKIPFVVRGLRHYGGHKGYRIAAELCP